MKQFGRATTQALGGMLLVVSGHACRSPDPPPSTLELGDLKSVAAAVMEPPAEDGEWVTEIIGVFRLEHRILVVDRTSPHVRILSETGAPVGVAGRSGSGPGELRAPWRATMSGDSLFVLHQGQLSVLDPGDLAEARRTPSVPGAISFHPACASRPMYVIAVSRPVDGGGWQGAGLHLVPAEG